ncbi:hypothetical protein V8G54_016441, partial [Vigna mungo]
EHCGCVHGLGFGLCPSKVFGINARCHSASSSVSPSFVELQTQLPFFLALNLFSILHVSSLTSHVNEMKTMMTFMLQNYQGQLPSQFSIFQPSHVIIAKCMK